MRTSRPTAALVALALGGAVLTGCTESPTNAATVNGTTITRAQLQHSLSGANQVLGDSNQLSSAQVLTVLIQGEVAQGLAQQRGLRITDTERNAKLSAAALSVPAARDFVYDVADANIVAAQVGEAQLTATIKSADVVINPRYGTWQPSSSVAVVAGTGSLSQVLQPADS